MQVTYKRLYNLGNYENETFEVIDQVADGETPRAAAERLRVLVDEMRADAAAWRDEQRRQAFEQRRREREATAEPAGARDVDF